MITQDPDKIETLLDKTKDRLSEILAQVGEDSTFHLATSDARTLLTSASGMAFDLRQSENALSVEIAATKAHMYTIEALHDRVELLRIEAARVVGALMENAPLE